MPTDEQIQAQADIGYYHAQREADATIPERDGWTDVEALCSLPCAATLGDLDVGDPEGAYARCESE